MERVLVTGGAGVLGHQVVEQLKSMGYIVRVMSRHNAPVDIEPGIEWVQADLETGNGLAQAVADVQTIVHAASSPFRQVERVDVEGTRKLLEQAQTAGVSHLVYISIVGIDRISYPYYHAKLAAEEIIAHNPVPWTILRATQFHDLLDLGLQFLAKFPLMPLPTDLQFQPVDSGEVATVLAKSVAQGPAGRLPDMGGPEVLRMKELARVWLEARGQRRLIVPLHIPGAVGHGFRHGYATCPDNRQGQLTWGEWVRRKYAERQTQAHSPSRNQRSTAS